MNLAPVVVIGRSGNVKVTRTLWRSGLTFEAVTSEMKDVQRRAEQLDVSYEEFHAARRI